MGHAVISEGLSFAKKGFCGFEVLPSNAVHHLQNFLRCLAGNLTTGRKKIILITQSLHHRLIYIYIYIYIYK